MRAVLEHMQLVAQTQLGIAIRHQQRTVGRKPILGGCCQEHRRRILCDMVFQGEPGTIFIRYFLLAGQQLHHEIGHGMVGGRHGGIAQNHGIGLVFSHHAGRQRQMATGREAAGDDLLRIDVPRVGMLPDIANDPGNLLQGGKIGGIPTGGIAQNKGMEAAGGIAQGNRLCLPGGAVQIAAAGANHDGRPLLLLAQLQLAIENIALQSGFFMTGNTHLDHFHNVPP